MSDNITEWEFTISVTGEGKTPEEAWEWVLEKHGVGLIEDMPEDYYELERE